MATPTIIINQNLWLLCFQGLILVTLTQATPYNAIERHPKVGIRIYQLFDNKTISMFIKLGLG